MLLFWIANILRALKKLLSSYNFHFRCLVCIDTVWKTPRKTARLHESHEEESCSHSLSPHSTWNLNPFIAGWTKSSGEKSQTHIMFLSVTFCICYILEFRFSWQMWNNTCSWNPPEITRAAVLSTWVVLVITVGLHPLILGLYLERDFYLNGIWDEIPPSCLRNPPSVKQGRLFPPFLF